MRVLVTRPQDDFARTAQALAARGHMAVAAPLFQVCAVPMAWSGPSDAVIAASANAIRMADPVPTAFIGLPCLTVGSRTADAAREAGFRDVRSADGDAAALARLVRASLAPGAALLHLAGRPRRDAAILALAGTYILRIVETYETIAVADLPAVAADALRQGAIDAVLHFSPRATQVFTDLAEKAGLLAMAQGLVHVAISAAATDPRLPCIKVAGHPDLESIIAAL